MNNIDTPSEAEDAGGYKQDGLICVYCENSKHGQCNDLSCLCRVNGHVRPNIPPPLPVQGVNERAEAYASKGKPEGLSHTSALANAIVESLKEAYIAGANESLSVPVVDDEITPEQFKELACALDKPVIKLLLNDGKVPFEKWGANILNLVEKELGYSKITKYKKQLTQNNQQ